MICRKHELPVERRVEDRSFRGETRGSNDNRPSSYRNDRIERSDRGMERGRQMSPAQRTERDRFDSRRPADEFRRDRRDDGNQPEWRGRDRPQGKFTY